MKFNKRILLLLVLSLLLISSAFAISTTNNEQWLTLQTSLVAGVIDQSSNSYNAVNNGATYDAGDDVFDFDGTNDFLNESALSLSSATSQTYSFWANMDTTTDHNTFDSLHSGGDRFVLSIEKAAGFGAGKIGLYDGSWKGVTYNTPTATWVHFVYVLDISGTTTIYADGSSLGTLSVTPKNIGTEVSLGSEYRGGTQFFNGQMAGFTAWSRALSGTEVSDLYAEGRTYNAYTPIVSEILTVNFQNAINLSNISNVIVNYDGTNFTNATGNQVKINITAEGGNSSLLQNFTVYAADHLSQDIENWNLTSTYAANLTQSDINYSISEIYTGNAINIFNLTIDNGTKYQTTNGTINLGLNAGTEILLIEALNYPAQNKTYTITAEEVSNVTLTDIYNGTLELHLVQEQDTNISITAFTAYFTPNGTQQVYPTSNGSVYIPVLFGDTYNFTFVSAGYFTGYENITINQSYQNETYNLSLEGGVLFTFRDSVTQNIITGELNLIVENATFSQTYTFTGGTQIVTNLTENQEFDFYFYGAGYQTNSYYLTYENQTTIDLYLINGTDNITYTVLTEGSAAIPDTEITIDKFLSGSWVQIASQLTDVTGRAVFGLERGITHRITFNKEGYTSIVDINRFNDVDFTVVLEESAQINFDLGFQDIRLVVTPTNSTLSPIVTNFSASITSDAALFEYVLLKIYYNGTLLGQDNSTSNVGATLNVNLDLSSYNDTLIMLEYTYKVINVTEVTYGTKVYKVVDTVHYEGTLLELKDRLEEKLSIGEKVALYAIVFILTLIFVSIFATGLPAVVAALLLATLAGWVFGINIVLLLFVTTTITIFAIAYTGDVI